MAEEGSDPQPNKGGRPTMYRDEYVEQGRKLANFGATDDEIADFFQCSVKSLVRWKLSYTDFGDALRVGKDQADERVVRSLYHRALGYRYVEQQAIKIAEYNDHGKRNERVVVVDIEKHVTADTVACIFWLKNRKRADWRDKQEHEHTVFPVNINGDDAEL